MTGLELLKSPSTTAEQIADIVTEQCPPVALPECDGLSCRGCWISWLTTGEPPKATGPSGERTAPGEVSAPYRPPYAAIRRAAEQVREGHMEYTATALTRTHGEGPRQS